MAIIITDECINCDACVAECPNNAIYEPDTEWSFAEGTELSGMVSLPLTGKVDANEMHEAISDEFYFFSLKPLFEIVKISLEPEKSIKIFVRLFRLLL